MEKDPSQIPFGDHCYCVLPLQGGEVLENDIERFGKDLREFSCHPRFKEVLCPYWRRTDYATVKCLFVEVEVRDVERYSHDVSMALLAAELGSEERARAFPISWALPDKEKICGVNTDHTEEA